MFRLDMAKKTVKNSAKEILSTAKFIPSSDVKITLEDIPEELRLEQRPDIVDKIIKQEFRWSLINGALGYEIALKNLNTGEWQYFGNIKDTNFHIPIEAGKYLWKVRAGGSEYGNWSLPGKFRVNEKGEGHDIDLEFRENIELKKKEIYRKETRLKSTPIQLAVILEGLGCNISCIYCSHKLQTKSTVKLHPELIADIANYLSYVKTVSFGGSEPMLYPEFRQICDMVENYPEVQLSICTNGMFINEYWAKRFCRGNFPWIQISVDGATLETYEAVRRQGNLEKILKGVDLINSCRSERGIPKLQCNYVVTTLNFHEMVQFVKLAHDYNIDVINFKMLIVKGDAPAVKHVKLLLEKKRMQISPLENEQTCLYILELLEKAESLAFERGILIIDHIRPYIYNRYPHLAKSQYKPQELTNPQALRHSTEDTSGFFCHMPFVNFSFGDGRAHFCCYSKDEFLFIPYDYDCRSLDHIWNSPKYQEARRLMYEDPEMARKIICKPTCPHYKTGLKNKFLQ